MLTVENLLNTLADDRHLGWGFACMGSWNGMGEGQYELACRNIVAVANELGLDYEGIFMWSNSKYGRWLSDECGRKAPSRKTVRQFLHPDAIATS